MKTSLKHIPCPLCGKEDVQRLGKPKISEKLQQLMPDVEKVSIVKCKNCGFYYTDPMPFWSKEDLQALYDEEYFPEMTEWWKNVRTQINPRRRLDVVERYASSKICRFLEVGCGEGYAIEEAIIRGWSVYGQDVSEVFARKVKKRLRVDIFIGSLEKAHYPDNYFDVVYIDAVLEHVHIPKDILREIHRMLRPGGIAYIGAPNEDALINSFRGLIFLLISSKRSAYLEPLQSPYHIVGFNKSTLQMLCQGTGFEIKQIKVSSGSDELLKFKVKNPWVLVRNCLLHPIFLLGEILGRGTTLETVVSVHK